MRRLLCRWSEYYLALCEEDIERGLPSWVRRHVHACVHCQTELQTYGRTREVVHRYAELLPDAPPQGWRALQVEPEVGRRPFLLQATLAPVAVAVVAVLGFVLWQRLSLPTGDVDIAPHVAQSVTPPQPDSSPGRKPAEPVAIPSAKGNQPKQEPPKQPAAREQSKPVPSSPPASPAPAYRPPKRILVASQPTVPTAEEEDAPMAKPHFEPDVPVQPVLVEASPSPSRDIPQALVIQPAYAAAAGGIE